MARQSLSILLVQLLRTEGHGVTSAAFQIYKLACSANRVNANIKIFLAYDARYRKYILTGPGSVDSST